MGILERANERFDAGDFSGALELYKEASLLFGKSIVEYQFSKALEALGPYYGVDELTLLLLKNEAGDFSGRDKLIDFYRNLQTSKSVRSKDDRKNRTISSLNLKRKPLLTSNNDYKWAVSRPNKAITTADQAGLSIIIPTFNRPKLLDITLACLVNQDTTFPYEVIVADDGSSKDLIQTIKSYEGLLDIKYVRQADFGYRLCAIRNLGLRTASYNFVSLLDCDMAPDITWVNSYVNELLANSDFALIGPRKYVDTKEYTSKDFLSSPEFISQLPEVLSKDTVGRIKSGNKSVDWRLDHFKKTESLRLCNTPFRFFSGGNVAFSKSWLNRIGYFDEEFTDWGGEDNEFAYRLFRSGCFFKVVYRAFAYHQEPPGPENETDRAAGKLITTSLVRYKVPYFYRKKIPIEDATIYPIPTLSIMVSANGTVNDVSSSIDSVLAQTFTDLEVCVYDFSPQSKAYQKLENRYLNNPRVKLLTDFDENEIYYKDVLCTKAKGYYVGFLQPGCTLLPDSLEICLQEITNNRLNSCVYSLGSSSNLKNKDSVNFLLFTLRAFNLTLLENKESDIKTFANLIIKLSEIGKVKSISNVLIKKTLNVEQKNPA